MQAKATLLAVSGGLDSMVMLHQMLGKHGAGQIAVAHCNFQLRGAESDRDEAFVIEVCEKYGVQCFSTQFDTKRFAREQGLGTQEAARKLRYTYFFDLMAEHGYSSVATAHHVDDSIETFFINLLRGSGPKGLSGIHEDESRGLTRPLLAMTRNEIEAYARVHELTWREDSSNASDTYLRNKLRHDIIPALSELRPGFRAVMKRNMAIQAQAQALIAAEVLRYREKCLISTGKNQWRIKRDSSAQESLLLSQVLLDFGFNATQVDSLLASSEAGKQVFSDAYVLSTGSDFWTLEQHEEVPEGKWLVHENLQVSHLPIELQFEVLGLIPEHLNQGQEVALLDGAKLRFPLSIRPWQAGDKIQPLGMTGLKSVSDILGETDLSPNQKKRVFVLLSGQEICWVLGHRISDRFKVTSASRNLLKITMT